MSGRGLAFGTKLQGRYDNGGALCCKHTMYGFLHRIEAGTLFECPPGGRGLMNDACSSGPQCARHSVYSDT